MQLGQMDQAKLNEQTESFEASKSPRRKVGWRIRSRRNYEKRTAAGLCTYAGCTAAASSHRYCEKHLQAMAERQRRRLQKRKKEGLCRDCGKRPAFWGLQCIICRQTSSRNPLPLGARRALREYREAEKKLELEMSQAHARFEIRRLLASGSVTGDYAKALRLYAGTSVSRCSRWRTYQEVGRLMHLSIERVRQLLKPSKIILADKLGDKVPWKPVRRNSHGDKFPRVYRRKLKCAALRNGSSRSNQVGRISAGN